MEHAVRKSYGDIHNTLTVLYEKSGIVYFASSITENVVTFRLSFPVKLICFTTFGTASSAFFT